MRRFPGGGESKASGGCPYPLGGFFFILEGKSPKTIKIGLEGDGIENPPHKRERLRLGRLGTPNIPTREEVSLFP